MTISELKKLLRPVRLREDKVRFGNRQGDGGYSLLPSEILQTPVVYSPGVGAGRRDILFDLEMAGMGKTVYLFDGTIRGPACRHPNFRFVRENINSANLWEAVRRFGHEHLTTLTAQIDVEGAEYEALGNCDERYFGVFSQIALELHNLHTPTGQMEVMLRRLNERYHIFHVVANNCELAKRREPLVEGMANVIEISLLRKDRIGYVPEPETLGSPQCPPDVPNNPDLPALPVAWWLDD